MILSRRVSLNGVQLDELDERIVVTGIEEAAGKDQINAVSTAMGNGQRVTNKWRDSLDVTVKFRMMIRKNDLQARGELLEKVNGWAYQGGWLKVSYRNKRRLMVTLAQAPGAGDLWQWTNEYSIVFRAYGLPYWQSTILNETVSEKISGSNMFIESTPGQIPSMLSFKATNISGKDIDTISVTADNGDTLTFKGLALKADKSLTWDYTINERIYVPTARISTGSGTKNVMAALDPASSDMIMIPPQQRAYRVYVSASRAIKMSLWLRGLYL